MSLKKIPFNKKKITIISVSALVVISALIFVFIWLFNSNKDLKIVFNDGEKHQVFSYKDMFYSSFELTDETKEAKLNISNAIEGISEVYISMGHKGEKMWSCIVSEWK